MIPSFVIIVIIGCAGDVGGFPRAGDQVGYDERPLGISASDGEKRGADGRNGGINDGKWARNEGYLSYFERVLIAAIVSIPERNFYP